MPLTLALPSETPKDRNCNWMEKKEKRGGGYAYSESVETIFIVDTGRKQAEEGAQAEHGRPT